MTLLPLQHPARSAGNAECSKPYKYSWRDSGDGSNQAGGKFRLPSLDRVEDEPGISVPERFDIPQTGNVNVWYGEWLRKICVVAIQHDNPRYSCSAGIEARNRSSANNTIQSSRPMVKGSSTHCETQEYVA